MTLRQDYFAGSWTISAVLIVAPHLEPKCFWKLRDFFSFCDIQNSQYSRTGYSKAAFFNSCEVKAMRHICSGVQSSLPDRLCVKSNQAAVAPASFFCSLSYSWAAFRPATCQWFTRPKTKRGKGSDRVPVYNNCGAIEFITYGNFLDTQPKLFWIVSQIWKCVNVYLTHE